MHITCFIILLGAAFSSFQSATTLEKVLNKPFDLQQFKKKKGQSNSGGANKRSYYYKPAEKGFYMSFSIFDLMKGYIGEDTTYRIDYKEAIYIVTYKPFDKDQDMYLDPNETLIEIKLLLNEQDLPQLAYVGLDTIKVKNKLGDDFIRKNDCFIYSNRSAALTLKTKAGRVSWLKWTRLNFVLNKDNVPEELVNE